MTTSHSGGWTALTRGSRALATRAVTAGLLATVAAGCHTLQQGGPGDTVVLLGAAPDTVRGLVSVTGSERVTAVVLTPVAGGAPVAVAGAYTATLRALGGIEVMATGRRTGVMSPAIPRGGDTFEVERFVVRAVDGVAATDGIVASDDGRFYLVTAAGSRLAANFLPAALRQKVGARVFLAGSLDRSPASYGIILERP